MQLIPAIDLRGGRCVRLLKGNFSAETRYEIDPLALLKYYHALGARWLHIVDLDGARDGVLANRHLIASFAAEGSIALQVGGGVRSTAVVADLLGAGVARVVIGSAAVDAPLAVEAWLRQYGSERVCLALDVRLDGAGVPLLQTRGWREATQLTLWQAIDRFTAAGLKHVLCTDIDRDGALSGPNVALYRECARRYPQLYWQASGGIAGGADLQALADAGASAAISGKALLEQRISIEELRPYLPAA
ncbi:MAG: 1-(5-phosphoribosyl)-5-[(5-phosphoribosylamino)methylideneamino] imidazole-4-carboxamide isomerase [Steroidobacteraceae bacterium]|jgi:phosphoribosylformimino-5-aminoimidazole carboxamide ribotide isomerase